MTTTDAARNLAALMAGDLANPSNRLVLADALEEAGADTWQLRCRHPLVTPDGTLWVWLMSCRGQVFHNSCLEPGTFRALRRAVVIDKGLLRLAMRQKAYPSEGDAYLALAEALAAGLG
jgi:hypothetical protein